MFFRLCLLQHFLHQFLLNNFSSLKFLLQTPLLRLPIVSEQVPVLSASLKAERLKIFIHVSCSILTPEVCLGHCRILRPKQQGFIRSMALCPTQQICRKDANSALVVRNAWIFAKKKPQILRSAEHTKLPAICLTGCRRNEKCLKMITLCWLLKI